MNLEFDRIVVLLTEHGTDTVILYTSLPPSVWPMTESPALRFEVARGHGADYVRTNFNVEPEILDVRTPK